MSGIVNIVTDRSNRRGVLVGNKTRSLDKQNRVTVSANWRHAFGSDESGDTHVYVAPGKTSTGQACLDLIPESVIERRYAFLEDIEEDDPARAHMAALFNMMDHKKIDVQGRVGLIPKLLKYAGIKDNVLMEGAGDCVKITAIEDDTEELDIDIDLFIKSRMALAQRKKQQKDS